MKIGIYRDWEEACANSRFNRAVGKVGKIRHNGQEIDAEIVKLPGKDGYLVYAGSHLKIRQAAPAEVDRVAKWRPW